MTDEQLKEILRAIDNASKDINTEVATQLGTIRVKLDDILKALKQKR